MDSGDGLIWLVRGVGRLLLLCVVELFFEGICALIGRVFLHLVTLGQYQPKGDFRDDTTWESGVGLIVIVLVTTLILL